MAAKDITQKMTLICTDEFIYFWNRVSTSRVHITTGIRKRLVLDGEMDDWLCMSSTDL